MNLDAFKGGVAVVMEEEEEEEEGGGKKKKKGEGNRQKEGQVDVTTESTNNTLCWHHTMPHCTHTFACWERSHDCLQRMRALRRARQQRGQQRRGAGAPCRHKNSGNVAWPGGHQLAQRTHDACKHVIRVALHSVAATAHLLQVRHNHKPAALRQREGASTSNVRDTKHRSNYVRNSHPLHIPQRQRLPVCTRTPALVCQRLQRVNACEHWLHGGKPTQHGLANNLRRLSHSTRVAQAVRTAAHKRNGGRWCESERNTAISSRVVLACPVRAAVQPNDSGNGSEGVAVCGQCTGAQQLRVLANNSGNVLAKARRACKQIFKARAVIGSHGLAPVQLAPEWRALHRREEVVAVSEARQERQPRGHGRACRHEEQEGKQRWTEVLLVPHKQRLQAFRAAVTRQQRGLCCQVVCLKQRKFVCIKHDVVIGLREEAEEAQAVEAVQNAAAEQQRRRLFPGHLLHQPAGV